MIKNNKQASSAKETLKELEISLAQFISKKAEMSIEEFELGYNSFYGLIEHVKKDIHEYENLINGNILCFESEKLGDINKIFISTRIAKKISQRELAQIIGIQEQQIQRYESSDYESATWTRIQEIALALDLNLKFEKIIISAPQINFRLPSNIDYSSLQQAKNNLSVYRHLNRLVPAA